MMTDSLLPPGREESIINFAANPIVGSRAGPKPSISAPLVFWRGKANHQLLEALQDIEGLDNIQKKAMLYRVSSLVDEYTHRANVYGTLYHFGRAAVTIGSLIVPALLSIQGGSTPIPFANEIYWFTWCTSLLVTTFNGVLTLFKVEKKYFFLTTIMEQVRSEGWQYISLTGRYGGHHHKPNPSTHSNEYAFFTHAIERIKLNQTNEEFWKTQDTDSNTEPNVTAIQRKQLNGLFTPTPAEGQLSRALSSIAEEYEKPEQRVDGGK
jgi:hypothetical protein